jgi:hypothetical protein
MSIEGNAQNVPAQFEEIHDILHVMREQESSIYARTYVADELVALWRGILVEWMYYVVDFCKLQRQTVGAAAFFLDVAMSRGLIGTREEHQLAAATALQLALKTFDSTVIKIEKLVKLGRGLFTVDDVVTMESKILLSMNWHLHPPSTYCFLRQYERLVPSSVSEATRGMIEEVTKLVSKLSVTEHKYTQYPTSVVAYASILVAMELVDYADLSIRQRQCFVLHMSTVAKLDTKSEVVLKAFEDLKESLDSSSKLQDVIDSISNVRKEKQSKEESGNQSSSQFNQLTIQSPRDVKARLGHMI